MKGLLRNNFIGVLENMKVIFPIVIILGIILVAIGNPSMLPIFSIAVTPIFSIVVVLCLSKEAHSKWYKYKLSLPVTRKNIIQSYYICHLFWCAAGMTVVTVFMALTVLFHGNQYFYYGFRDAITLILVGAVLAILIGSAFYPLYCLLGAARAEVIAVISVILSILIVAGLTAIVNALTGDNGVSNTTYYISLFAIVIITSIIFIASYALSTALFKNKDY